MIAKRKYQPAVENGTNGRASQVRPTDRFETALHEYVERIAEIFGTPDIAARPAKAYYDCAQAFYDQQVPSDVRQQLADAYDRIVLAWQEQARGVATQTISLSVTDAYYQYSKLLSDAWKDHQGRVGAAQRYFYDVVRDTPTQLRQQVDDAYRTYVGSLHSAWAEVAPETLDGSDLLEINQSIAQALAGHIAALNATNTPGPSVSSSRKESSPSGSDLG